MATVAFGFVGGLVAGELGFAAGTVGATAVVGLFSTAGAYVDANYIFKQEVKSKPPNEDLKFSAADEGAPLPITFGTTRCPGTIIWVSETRKRENPDSGGGGKGGGGSNPLPNIFDVDLAIALCQGEIEDLEELHCNGIRVYQQRASEFFDNFSVRAAVRDEEWHRTEQEVANSQHRIQWFGEFRIELKSLSGGPDLTTFVPGGVFEMSGWTAPYTANNTIHGFDVRTDNRNFDTQSEPIVESVRKDNATNDTYVTIKITYRWSRTDPNPTSFPNPPTPLQGAPFANFPDGTGGQSIHIFEATAQFSTKQLSGVTVYNGTQDQLPDPTIEASEQDADVPAFRGIAYVVVKGLILTDFGNSLPFRIEGTVRRKTNHTLEDVIDEVISLGGLDPNEIDASALSNVIVKGSYALTPATASAILENFILAYDIVVQGDNGVQRFFLRSDAEDLVVPDEDLAAHELGGDVERDFVVEDLDRSSIPRAITVLYRDPEKRYQTSSQLVRRAATLSLRTQRVDLGVSMNDDEAHAVAGRLLWLAELGSRKVTVQLPPSYIGRAKESVRLNLNIAEQPIKILLSQVDRGDNGLVRCEGVREDERLLSQPLIASTPGVVMGDSIQSRGFLPPPPTWGFFDNACLDDSHVEQPGFYWWASVAGLEEIQSTIFGLYESIDDGDSYSLVGTSIESATTGTCSDGFNAAALPGFWDNASSIDVTLRNATIGLESVTELQCLNGRNRGIFGNEVIGYQNAELIAPGVYRLTKLLRGLQGTEAEIDKHFEGERFVSLSNPGVTFLELNSAALFTERLYKVVPLGGRLTDYEERCIIPAGGSVRPLPPVNITIERDASNNVTVAFTRRSRGMGRAFSPAVSNVHEARVAYYVDAMDPVTPTVRARRLTAASSETEVSQGYTAAEQTADGYTPGDPVTMELRQVSAWLGTSRAVSVTG